MTEIEDNSEVICELENMYNEEATKRNFLANRFSSHIKSHENEKKIFKPSKVNPISKRSQVIEKAKLGLMQLLVRTFSKISSETKPDEQTQWRMKLLGNDFNRLQSQVQADRETFLKSNDQENSQIGATMANLVARMNFMKANNLSEAVSGEISQQTSFDNLKT